MRGHLLTGVNFMALGTRTFIYDLAGQKLQELRAVGSPLQQAYATYTHRLNGKPASVTDANGNLSAYAYDGLDRLAHTTLGTGVANPADYERFTYDGNSIGRLGKGQSELILLSAPKLETLARSHSSRTP